MIPNFCLGSQPSGIPLIFAWIAFRFSTHCGSLYRHYFSLFLLSLLFPLKSHAFYLSLFSLSFRYGYMRGFDCFNLPLSLLVNINQSIIMTTSLKTKRWTPLSSQSSWSVFPPWVSNGWRNGGALQVGSIVSSKTTVFLWLGFAVALTTPQAALWGDLVTIKEFLMMMASFISQFSLRGSWAWYVRLG